MEKTDISFKNLESKKSFNFRVALISIFDGKILLQKAEKDEYYSLIGGRVKLGESTKDAIVREAKEEIGITFKNEELTLIKIVENFFTYNGMDFHKLLYIYKVDNEQIGKMDNFKTLDKDNVVNKWIQINNFKNLDVRPSIIKECYNEESLSSEIIGK